MVFAAKPPDFGNRTRVRSRNSPDTSHTRVGSEVAHLTSRRLPRWLLLKLDNQGRLKESRIKDTLLLPTERILHNQQ
jgi:hypothetical protein